MTHPSLSGKIALITGASRGIGRAVALAYAKAGATVVLAARNDKQLEEVDDLIRAAGGEAILVPLDLMQGEAIDQLGAVLHQQFGRLDILVANAGILGHLTPLAHAHPEMWDKVIATNLTANYRLIRSLDPLLQQAAQQHGAAHALFVTSGVTQAHHPFWGAYAVSKAGLEMLVGTYAAETAGSGVQAHLIDPGVVRTGMRAQAFPGEDPQSLPPPEAILDRFFAPLAQKKKAA